ncbi:unnamed protein product [Paramecium primaurelia]|uniref:Tetratricopeptide repeat protein n=1 Tax=Paramecium primaurelia TaxID=5886 RepID=A0A8S1QRM0_PARPR|nr:unnamed protein product [Paramecium primaurelia]
MIQKDEQEQRQQCKITKRSQIIDEVKQKKTEVIDKDLLKFKQLFDERNYEEALLEIEEKIKQNELLKENKKNNDELLMHKSIVLIQLDKYDEFLECINQAITLNPKNEKLLYHKGITLVKLDQYQQAFQCFDEAIKINPDNQASLIYLGITLEGIYNYNGAYKCYNEAQKYDQNFQLLNILKEVIGRKYDEAIELCDKPFSNTDLDKFAYTTKGRALLMKLRYEEVIKICDKVIQIDETLAEAYDIKASLLRPEEAIQQCQKAIQLDSKNYVPYSTIAGALIQLRREEEAIEYCEMSLKINPRGDIALGNKGIALFDLNRFEEAVECFDQALSIRQNHPIINLLMGTALAENNINGRMKRPLRLLTNQFHQSQIIIKHFIKKEGGFVEAIVSLNKALKLNSNVFSIWNSKGRLLLNMNRYEEAILCFKTLFQLNSNDNVAIEQIRETLESLNRIEEAIAFISQAVINNPQSHVSKFQMAKTLLRIGSFEEALIFSQQALSMQPQNQQYLQLYCKVVFMQQLSKGCLEKNEQGN